MVYIDMKDVRMDKLSLMEYGIEQDEGGGFEKSKHVGVSNAWKWYDGNFEKLGFKEKQYANVIMDMLTSRYCFLVEHNRDPRHDYDIRETIKKYHDLKNGVLRLY